MATHHIGSGTANFSVNLLEAEQRAFGRLAVAEDRSMGEIIRRYAVLGLQAVYPQVASELVTARQEHRQTLLHLDGTHKGEEVAQP